MNWLQWQSTPSFEDNFPGVSDGRSVRMIDFRKLDVIDCDKRQRIHVGRKPRIM